MATIDVDDGPIPYMQRTRDYYVALGYSNPYRWAHLANVPFTPLATPLARAKVALITTAAPFQDGVGDQGPGAPYNAGREVLPGLLGSLDRPSPTSASPTSATTAATPRPRTSNTWLPLARLKEAVAAGRIGALTPACTARRRTGASGRPTEPDAPELLRRCQEDGADAVVLVPS